MVQAYPPGYDKDDPAPDVYSIKRKENRILVCHYKNRFEKKRCCHAVIKIESGESVEHALGRPLAMPCGIVS